MRPEKDQVYIFTDDQLSLIKNTFAENDELLYAIRNVLLQFPLSEGQTKLVKSLKPEVIEILRIRMLPELGPKFPLGQLPSLLSTLTEDMKTHDVELMAPKMEAKVKEIAYLEQQFQKLANLDTEEMLRLKDMGHLMGKSPYQQFVDIAAYLFLVGYIDPSLNMIRVIAGTKQETVEETKKRMHRDSSK
jgi:hypothetical protein